MQPLLLSVVPTFVSLLMAFYCKMKLSPLKVTKCRVGSKCTSVVHQGKGTSSDESISCWGCNEPGFLNSEDMTETEAGVETPMYFPDSPVTNEPPTMSFSVGWEQLRGRFLLLSIIQGHYACFVQVLQNFVVKIAAPSSSCASTVSSVTMRRSTSFMLLKNGKYSAQSQKTESISR